MSEDNNQAYEIIEKGDLVMLRTLVETDGDHYMRWQTQGDFATALLASGSPLASASLLRYNRG